MPGIVIVSITIITLMVVVWKPKLGPVLLWPMLFMYPHYYMWQRALLPLNIGIDDLFTCVFFVIVFVRRIMMEGVRPKLGYAWWAVVIYFFLIFISNLNSFITLGTPTDPQFLKETIKGIIPVLLVFSLLSTIDDFNDLRMMVFAFCFFAGLGAIIVILQHFKPGLGIIFAHPKYVEKMSEGYLMRPCGAFLNTNNAALVMANTILILISTMRIKSKCFIKSIRLVILVILAVAILVTRSRGGFASLAIVLFLMLLIGKHKRYALAFAIVGLIVLFAMPGIRELLFVRFTGAYGEFAEKGFWWSLGQRWKAAFEVWDHVTISNILFGMTAYAFNLRSGTRPHDTYFGHIITYGIGGLIWVIWFVIAFLRRSNLMRRHPDWRISCFGYAIFWCFLSMAMYGITTSVFKNVYVLYMIFLLAVIAQRGTDFINEDELLYEDGIYIYDNNLDGTEAFTEDALQ